ncbi:MAG: hypothetical protein AAB608_01520 [Patescibacteria group bacterium]
MDTLIILSAALALAAVIEFYTLALRLSFHLKSKEIQREVLHVPRVHHSYPGIALLIIHYAFYPSLWLAVIGWALVLSDLFHHTVALPLMKKRGYDIGMRHHNHAHVYFKHGLAVVLIATGLVAFFTPFTPGSWLVFPGLAFIIGKKNTRSLLHRVLGKKISEDPRVENALKKL